MGGEKRGLLGEILRFNLVGIVNTALTYLAYSALVALSVDYRLALALEYCAGVAFSFAANKRFTFGNREATTLRMVVRMVGSYAILLALNMTLLVLLVERMGLGRYLGQLIALAIVVSLSFSAQKLLVFRKGGAPEAGDRD